MENIDYSKLTIYEVDTLRSQLMSLIDTSTSSIVLDFSSIEKIDMVAIQLLLSMQKSCHAKKIQLSIANVIPTVKDSFKLCACDYLLGDMNE